jgi:4-amino-4-deoxy-L-arabinose transferase-like glycosyltransferase
LTTTELYRGGPTWYFLPYLVAGFFPWILVAGAAGVARWREIRTDERRPLVYLLLWVALPLLFFSLSQSKRPHYLLPLVPAAALLTAWSWSEPVGRRRGIRLAALGLLLCGSALNVAAAYFVGQRLGGDPSLARAATSVGLSLGAVMMLAGAAAWVVSARRELALVALSLPALLLPLIAQPVAKEVAGSRSAKQLAAVLRPHLTPSTRIVGIGTFSPSLTFYLGQPIHVTTSTGLLLASNYVLHFYTALAGAAGSTLHEPGWWQETLRSCSPPAIFLLDVRTRGEGPWLAAAGLPVLYSDGKLLAMGPCSPPTGSP